MTDVRALLAAERQARRISHPYLTYTKSGQLLCNICQLNVKSETLWEGHLRSANHKKNAKAAQNASSRSLKRKLDDVEEDEDDGSFDVEMPRDVKKPKSRAVSRVEEGLTSNGKVVPALVEDEQALLEDGVAQEDDVEIIPITEPEPQPPSNNTIPPDPKAEVDEDEWAAFEREVAPLKQTDYSNATISAAPVTAEELARRRDEARRKQQENDAEAEREEEEGRVQEEVEIMEDLEERVRKLRERREALRITSPPAADTGQSSVPVVVTAEDDRTGEAEEADESDDDDADDWYS